MVDNECSSAPGTDWAVIYFLYLPSRAALEHKHSGIRCRLSLLLLPFLVPHSPMYRGSFEGFFAEFHFCIENE